MLGLICYLSLLQSPQTILLYRGVKLDSDPQTPYYACQDTTLSPDFPERSFAQGISLRATPKSRILIRFADLERAVGPHKMIRRAKLILFPDYIQSPGEIRVSRFRGRWNEGPGMGDANEKTSHGATTWKYQFYSEKGKPKEWKNGGGKYVEKNPSAKASYAPQQNEIVIEGLQRDVQDFYERWYENWGWAIEVTSNVVLNSSEAPPSLRPRLELEVVDSPAPSGGDLSVIYISRFPEYERYDNRGDAYVRMNVNGHESGVMMNPGKADTQKWPKDGEEVRYVAVVKNVGDAPSSGFSYQWFFNDEKIAEGRYEQRIEPGKTVEFEIRSKFLNDSFDHRTQPIVFRITPDAQDALKSNDALEIQACALNIGIWVDEGFYESFRKQTNGTGSRAFEDWIQWQFRIWNDVFMAHSRFSFAQDGSRERVRIQKINIVPNGTLKGGAHLPNDTPTLTYDGEWGFDSSFGEAEKYIQAIRKVCDRALLHELSHQIGLIDLYWMNVDPSLPDGTRGKVKLKNDEYTITRGHFDSYAGLMGGGDTRNDIHIPWAYSIPNEPIENPALLSPLFEPTQLYSATDVTALNANVGYRRGFYGEFLYSVPDVVIVRCLDYQGIPIPSGTLSFYQMKNGALQDAPPDFTVDVKNGTALLPNRPTGLEGPFTTLTGHTLKPNPFGRIDVVGTNGVFLVRLDFAGQTEWAFLKVWQLVDAYARGNKRAYIQDLRFNVSHRPLKPENLALKRIVIDSRNNLQSELSKLVDGDTSTIFEFAPPPPARGGDSEASADWVEIDLGRDRPIGEVRLVVNGDTNTFWQKFEIWVYTTGQTVKEAQLFSREASWQFASAFRSDVNPKNFQIRSVAYRARPLTVRYIRIVNRSSTGGRLAEIEVRETEVGR